VYVKEECTGQSEKNLLKTQGLQGNEKENCVRRDTRNDHDGARSIQNSRGHRVRNLQQGWGSEARTG
jgi:hypothetical protein